MKIDIHEGIIFLVPLKKGGWARGVVSRCAPMGKILFGYFFGPRLDSKINVGFRDIRPQNAILSARFGDLGILNGTWPKIGNVERWNREDWIMPIFIRKDPLGRMPDFLIKYSDHDPSLIENEYIYNGDKELQRDSLSGYESISIKLDKILN